MKSRIHLEIDNNKLFNLVSADHPSVAALKVNPYTKPYEGICGTIGHETEDTSFEATYDERYERNSDGTWKFGFRVPYNVVMRGQIQCACCGPVCFHCGGTSKPVFGSGAPSQPTSGHMGTEYCESVLDLTALQPLAREATNKLGDKSYAAQLKSASDSLGLDPAWIQSHIPYLQGRVVDVFSGASTFASDIFYVAAFLQLILHPTRGWLSSAHNKLSKDWPQRPGKVKVIGSTVLNPAGSVNSDPAPATPSMVPAPAPTPATPTMNLNPGGSNGKK